MNLWVFCLLGGPFLGPFLSAWIIQAVDWRADYGILAGLYGFSCLLVVLIGEETLYDRQNPQSRPTGVLARIKLLLGVTGAQVEGRPTLWTVTKDLVRIQIRPQIFFITVIYVMVLVCWVIGIVSTWSEIVLAPPWLFSPDKFALSYLAPLIGAFVGQLWGHFFNDWLQNWYIRTHHGVYVLENRLWGTYAPTLIGFTGLILVGQTLQHTLSWMGLCLGWAFLVFAMVSATTAISAYCLDCFPKHASLVAAIINMWRQVSQNASPIISVLTVPQNHWRLLCRLLPTQMDCQRWPIDLIWNSSYASWSGFLCRPSPDPNSGQAMENEVSTAKGRKLSFLMVKWGILAFIMYSLIQSVLSIVHMLLKLTSTGQ